MPPAGWSNNGIYLTHAEPVPNREARPVRAGGASTCHKSMDVNTASGRPILVVDDERNIRKALELLFRASGYSVIEAEDGEAALRQVEELGPRLVLLDVEMPRLDGFETLRRLRRDSEVPVILLTVRNEDEDKDRGLQLGADDYITKPFRTEEVLLRAKAVLRRTERFLPGAGMIRVDDRLQFHPDRQYLTVGGQQVSLRPTECRLLQTLINANGAVLSNQQLLELVWGPGYDESQVRVYINYLRNKIEADSSNPQYIINVRGQGYFFENPGAAVA